MLSHLCKLTKSSHREKTISVVRGDTNLSSSLETRGLVSLLCLSARVLLLRLKCFQEPITSLVMGYR